MKHSSSFISTCRGKKSLNTETVPLTDHQIHSYTPSPGRGGGNSSGETLLSLLLLGLLSPTLLSLESCSQPYMHTHSHAHSQKWQEGTGWIFPLWLFLGSKIIGISTSFLWISFVFSKSPIANALFSPNVAKIIINTYEAKISCMWKLTHYSLCCSH